MLIAERARDWERKRRRAVNEYFADKNDQFHWIERARLHIVRK